MKHMETKITKPGMLKLLLTATASDITKIAQRSKRLLQKQSRL